MRWPSTVATALVVVASGPLWNLATDSVEISDRWVPWIWTLSVSLGILAVFIEVRRRSQGRTEGPGPGVVGLDQAVDDLALAVRTQWRREEERQRVHDPFPLPVAWGNAAEALIDHPANYRRLPPGTDAEPLDLKGTLGQIAQVYQRIPSRRLVILGKAGAGKTILAAQLLLDLLHSRTSVEPVPVSFSIGSWNPTTTGLRDWMADQMIRDHPGLAAPGTSGRSLAAELVHADRILPILDGFDEIAEGLHRPALEALNTIGSPLVLTSRPDEYAAAVTGTDVLTCAAGITLTDLTLADLANYLPRTTRPAASIDATTTGVWHGVLEVLRDHPHNPASANLAAVLTIPLMVALARTIYSDTPGQDPSELLDTDRFASPEAIEDHLLAVFVPTVYRHPPEGLRRWDPERVQHWLGYLAQHLDRLGTRDLAWWQLGATTHRTLRMITVGVMAGLAVGLVDWLVTSLVGTMTFGSRIGIEVWLRVGFIDGLVVGLVAGVGFGVAHGFVTRRAPIAPSRVRVQILGRNRGPVRKVVFMARVGLVAGLAAGFVLGFVAGAVTKPVFGAGGATVLEALASGLVDGIFWALLLGPCLGFAAGVITWYEAPLEIRLAGSPADLLKTNRTNVTVRLLLFGLPFGLVTALWGWAVAGLLQGLSQALTGGPVHFELWNGAMVGLVAVFGVWPAYVLSLTAWGQWVVLARLWLPLTGRLPRPVLAFLDDAYRRGVLRQAGAVYQFRHIRLQEHLARAFRTSPPASGRERH